MERYFAQAINDAVLTVLGEKPKHRFHVNDKIVWLSKQQQEMRPKIENVTDDITKNSLQKDRNEIMSPKDERARQTKIGKLSEEN